MNDMVRPLTEDGLFGYDQFGQLMLISKKDGYTTQTMMADVRDKTCRICNHGWEPNGPSIGDQYLWRALEEYVHASCFVRYQGIDDQLTVYCALCGVVRFEKLKAVPNGYWGAADSMGKGRPWYIVELLDHPISITIGMRKRVWAIELKSIGRQLDVQRLEEEFAKEDVTKGFTDFTVILHAWGDDNLRLYVRRLANVLKLGIKKETTP